MSVSRRDVLQLSAGAFAASALPARAAWVEDPPAPVAALRPFLDGMQPVTTDEHRARLGRAQRLLADEGLDAMVVGPGTSLTYFTGAEWGLSERFFGMVLTRDGAPAWVTPGFEALRASEQIRVGGDVRKWEEHESPFAVVAGILRDRKATGRVGLDEALPFAFVDGIGRALPASRLESGTPVTAGCRMIKDDHELALMKRACEITLRAHHAVFASLRVGMSQADVAQLSALAHRKLGVEGGSLVLFGADAAFPHGTTHPRPLAAGDVVLVDGGCRVHGYASDVTRTGVFGAPPTPRQRSVWDLVRRAQEAAFRAARPGVECQAVDAAARRVIEDGGFGPDYARFTHRVGHGIGMDGHEWTYLVRGNTTALRPGMCFSNEPGVYIDGEMGIRHEDVMTITESGAECLSRWPGTPESPVVA